ncbi:globin CTT-IX-like [Chironomus tepperi]|uniref:globin CTT-IX-like n=1 Tax=Chironomus tepperi TaxID=113505 RepID=UPI00391FC628
MKLFILVLCIIGVSCDLVPLVDDQTALVRASWNQVKHNEVDILAAIFKDNPDIQSRFPKFAGKDLKTLKATAAFATHAGRIVGFFSEITELNPTDSGVSAAKTLINQLAANHKGRGISKAQFNAFRASLTAYLSEHVTWDDNVATAWEKGFDNVYLVLFSALDGNPL